jgi:hypothetical protein
LIHSGFTKFLLALALGTIPNPSIKAPDIDGIEREPLKAASGRIQALFFVTTDCPVSNYYSHEIRRICDDYSHRGAACELIYVDPVTTDAEARRHAEEYGHGNYPKIVDRTHALVKATGARITPTAVLIKPDESISYRGRIDNFYAALGKPRQVVTEHNLRDALDTVLAGRVVAKADVPSVGCYISDLR